MKELKFVIGVIVFAVMTGVSATDIVSLDDGSQMTTQSFQLDGQKGSLHSPVDLLTLSGKNETFTLPRKHIACVLFRVPSDMQRWKRLADLPHPSDRIIVKRADSLDFYSGAVLAITPERVVFRPDSPSDDKTSPPNDDKTFQLNRSKLIGVIFARSHTARSLSAPGETLLLQNGGILHSTLEHPEESDGQYPWRLECGLAGLVPVKSIQSRQKRSRNVIDLSTLVPALAERISAVSTIPPLPVDSTLKNSLVYRVISGKIELAAPCRIAWSVPTGVNRIQGTVQIPEEIRHRSIVPNLIFVVRVDGKEILRERIGRKCPETTFSVSVVEIKLMEIHLECEQIPIPGSLVVLSGAFTVSHPGQ